MTFAPKNQTLLERLQLFAIGLPETIARFDREPLGVPLAQTMDPLRRSSVPFLELLQRLDEVTFGPTGMPMPGWLYVDAAELTGAIVGFGVPVTDAPERALELLRVPDDYRGLIPYAVFMAIPTSEPGGWFGHNLASLNSHLPDQNLSGLGGLVKAVALALYRAEHQIGATQWDSRALFVHTKLGPLALDSAWTPAHGSDPTLTYRTPVTEDRLRHLGGDESVTLDYPDPDQWIRSDDREALRQLQAEIEAGARVAISGTPEPMEDGLRVPLTRLQA